MSSCKYRNNSGTSIKPLNPLEEKLIQAGFKKVNLNQSYHNQSYQPYILNEHVNSKNNKDKFIKVYKYNYKINDYETIYIKQ